MSKKKAGGSSKNGRDSTAKRLGVKIYGDQAAKSGSIIVRQRGTKFRAGENVKMGRDHTLFATKDGIVKYQEKRIEKYDGRKFKKLFVSIAQG